MAVTSNWIIFAMICGLSLAGALRADDKCGDTVALNEPGKPFGPPLSPPGARRVIPARAQGKRGVCYGHAAANLIDAWRFTHPPTQPKPGQSFKLNSPLDIAIKTSIYNKKSSTIATGDEADAVDAMLEAGKGCDDDFIFANEQGLALSDDLLVRTLEEAWDDYAKYNESMARVRELYLNYKHTPKSQWTAEMKALAPYHDIDLASRKLGSWEAAFNYSNYAQGSIRAGQELQCELIARGVPAENIPASWLKDTNALLGRLLDGSGSKVAFLRKYFAEACNGHEVSLAGVPHPVQLPERGKKLYDPLKPEEVIRDINRKFDQGDGQPIAIGLCSAVLRKPEFEQSDRELYDAPYAVSWYVNRGLGDDGHPIWRCISGRPEDPNGGSSHAATLIGRRRDPKNPDKCQFLLRNSWGSECDVYEKAGWKDCKDGDVWIDAETLARNTMNITYLKP